MVRPARSYAHVLVSFPHLADLLCAFEPSDPTAQNESFEANIPFQGLLNPEIPFPAIFIRAPAIHSLVSSKSTSTSSGSGKSTVREDLCVLPSELVPHIPEIAGSPLGPADTEAMRIVAMKQGKKLVTSFHPELSGDLRVHEFFLRECCGMDADV